MSMQARHVFSGTHGSVWLDNEYVCECTGAQGKVTFNKETIPIPGQMMNDQKVMSVDGKGSLTMNKINTRMGRLIGDRIRDGVDVRFTIISKIADPDAMGAERVRITGVSFDDLTLFDWSHGTAGKVEAPFTFTGYEYLDTVEAQ